jgi:hypothetical protein
MRIPALTALLTASVMMLTGCQLDLMSSIEIEDEPVVVTTTPPPVIYKNTYVNAYVDIPLSVRELIADRVSGYSMPPVERYGYVLYPTDVVKDGNNIPSYVKADINGDGYFDYGYMFSIVSYNENYWYLKTKLIIVTSNAYGYEIGCEINLGTVSGPTSKPIEEYWGIRLLKSGTHNVTVTKNGYDKETIVELKYDGIYLASIDPAERSVFYADNSGVHEMILDMGSIAKKAANRADRVIMVK